VSLALTGRFKAAVPFILVTVFLDMLSIGIVVPVLPKLVESFVGSVSQAGLWTGIFGTFWGLAQFIFSPIQGGLSDRFGRRPVILASNFGTGADYVFMALAPNLWFLFIGRIISGITAASVSTAYAYISDITAPDNRARVFGYMGAAFGIGFVIGPVAGGFLGNINVHLPFYVAGALSLINFIYGFFVLPESLDRAKRRPFSIKSASPMGALAFLSRRPQVMRLSLMSLCINFAHSVLPITFVLYAGYRFNWSISDVAFCLAAVGVLSAIVQAGLTGLIVKRLGERTTMMLGLISGIVGFCGYGLSPDWRIFVIFIPIQCLWGLATPSIQSMMTALVNPKEQGELQGASVSLSSMATIFAPILFGVTLAYVTRDYIPMAFSGAAFLVAAAFLLVALWLGLGVSPKAKTANLVVPASE
jgi:MFS transporter, DHA1 family, tetracycline resistance protein